MRTSPWISKGRCWRVPIMGPSLEISRCFHASTDLVAMWKRQILLRHWSQPAKSEDKRGKHEAGGDPLSQPPCFERERDSVRPPTITGHGFAWKWEKKKVFPSHQGKGYSSFSLSFSSSRTIRNFRLRSTDARIWIWSSHDYNLREQ